MPSPILIRAFFNSSIPMAMPFAHTTQVRPALVIARVADLLGDGEVVLLRLIPVDGGEPFL